MRTLRNRGFSILAVLLVASALVTARAATLTGMEWKDDDSPGIRNLVFSFDGAVPDLDVQVFVGGLRVRLPETVADAGEVDRLRVASRDGGTNIELVQPGIRLLRARVDGSVLTLRLASPEAALGEGEGYRLGIGDVVSVSVYRDQDLTGDYTIGQSGTINMPLAGAITASGLTESELSEGIRAVLESYLVDPKVTVSIRSFESQFVHVTGAVARASRVTLRPGKTLKDVLSEAGVALGPGQEITLSRGDSLGGGASFRFDAEDLDQADVVLPRGGDVITVQDPKYIFVRGEVSRPGRQPYTPGLTLQQAITLAEGLTDWASKKDIQIQRKEGDGTVVDRVNLKRVENRKDPDPLLQPGDLVFVRRRVL